MSNRLDRIESSMADAEARIAQKDKALGLYDNPLFNEVIVKGYFEQESIRLVALYGSGQLTQEQKTEIERDMHAVGALKRFLRVRVQEGHQAERDLEAAKNEREDFLYEESEARRLGQEMPGEVDDHYAGSLGA